MQKTKIEWTENIKHKNIFYKSNLKVNNINIDK